MGIFCKKNVNLSITFLYFRSSGIPEDDIDTTAHVKLRSTVSLPSVSAHQVPGYPYNNTQSNIR